MLISKGQLGQRRSVSDLCTFVESIMKEVNSDPQEFESGILHKDLYKVFIDEILPLSQFAKQAYLTSENFEIEPVIGNQGFDAKVYRPYPKIHEHVEICKPHDGDERASIARRLISDGIGSAEVDQIDSMLPFIRDACNKKAMNDYSECVLVIVLPISPPTPGGRRARCNELDAVKRMLSEIKFKAKRVALLAPPENLIWVTG